MPGIKPLGQHRDKRLSAAFVRTATEPGFYADGNGLYLRVDPSGAKRWVQRIVIQGKRRDIGLGSASLIGLAEAREQAVQHRKAARAGNDPLADKKRSKAILTFQQAAETVHAINKPNWRNAKHGQQWINTLTTFAFPVIGNKRVDVIDSADMLAVLVPIWTSHPETARRVKQRLNSVMDWAKANGWRTDNPVYGITSALPKHDRRKIQHRQALPYDAVAAAITKIRESGAGAATKLALEFMVLTAARPSEAREAVWGEFDLDKATWTIPAARMKMGREHRIPLPDRALDILKDANVLKQEGSDLVFPGFRPKRPLSDMTLSKLMKELKIPAVPHGFRSSFRDWAAEQTNHPHDVCEFALAHVNDDKAAAAYKRTDLFDKRRALMAEWSGYLISNQMRHVE